MNEKLEPNYDRHGHDDHEVEFAERVERMGAALSKKTSPGDATNREGNLKADAVRLANERNERKAQRAAARASRALRATFERFDEQE